MMLDQHRIYVECNADSALLTAAETALLLTTAPQLPDPNSDISGSVEVKAATKIFKDEGEALLANKKASA